MAASVPVAAGAALAIKYKGLSNAAFVFFGDGATSRGDWHEGINLASVQKAPLVLICNNNAYAYSTPVCKQMGCLNVADRGAAYGIPAEIVDGNDVFAVHAAARRAVEHARNGLGPYLVECKTFRMTGHSAHDAAAYVPPELFQQWEKRDPIMRLERQIIERELADASEIERLRASIVQEVDEAIEWAEASPYPDPSGLLDNVYESR
jgi:pyruvate dehydrogenase E1 component alpha subunit